MWRSLLPAGLGAVLSIVITSCVLETAETPEAWDSQEGELGTSSQALGSCGDLCGPGCRIVCDELGHPSECACGPRVPTLQPCTQICTGENCAEACLSGDGSITTCGDAGFCLAPPPPPPARAARIVAQSVPAHMLPGGRYNVSITVQNTGTRDWSPIGASCNAFRLGATNPRDNATWGRARVDLPAAVPAGQTVTVGFQVTAPSTPGLYDFQWRMLQECVTWFGPDSHLFVTVGPIAGHTVLYLMGAAGVNMTAADRTVSNHLAARGYTVVPEYGCRIQDAQTARQAANGKSLVIVGGTVPAHQCAVGMGEAWHEASVPVLVSKGRMFPELGLTPPQPDSGFGSVSTLTQIAMVNPASPLSAGLSGSVTVHTAAPQFSAWGRPNANAIVAASIPGEAWKRPLFAYARGVLMPGGFSPACRVGAWWSNDDPLHFTAHAWKLFDAAVSWATSADCR
jgi:hypothetical protein